MAFFQTGQASDGAMELLPETYRILTIVEFQSG
jgi:hypothetical protein